MWLMIFIRTMGAIDLPGHGKRKLPAPGNYVAIVILWSIFGIIADMGAVKAAAIMGWTTLVTSLLVPGSPAAPSLIKFLNVISANFGVTPSKAPPQGTVEA